MTYQLKPGLKLLTLLLIVLGLVVGPAYWIRAKFFSGDDGALLTLKAVEPQTGLLRIWQSEPFRLEADMAPVGLIMLAQGRYSANMSPNRPPLDSYSITLTHAGKAAEPLKLNLGVKRVTDESPAFRAHLLLMQKVQPGDYAIAVTQAAEPAIQIDRMQLQVRQHLDEPDPDIVLAGMLMLAIGLFVRVLL